MGPGLEQVISLTILIQQVNDGESGVGSKGDRTAECRLEFGVLVPLPPVL